MRVVGPHFEAGNVQLPKPAFSPWVKFYVFEILRFPKSAFADQVDTTSHALVRLRGHTGEGEDFVTVGRSC